MRILKVIENRAIYLCVLQKKVSLNKFIRAHIFIFDRRVSSDLRNQQLYLQ